MLLRGYSPREGFQYFFALAIVLLFIGNTVSLVLLPALWQGRRQGWRNSRSGGFVVAMTTLTLVFLAWHFGIGNRHDADRYKKAMSHIQIVRVDEKPVIVQGQLAGLHLDMTIVVTRTMPFAAFNEHVKQLFYNMRLATRNADGSIASETTSYPHNMVLDGTPLSSSFNSTRLSPRNGAFASGTYRFAAVFWLPGLSARTPEQADAPPKPCLRKVHADRRAPTWPSGPVIVRRSTVIASVLIVVTHADHPYGERGPQTTVDLAKALTYRHDQQAWENALLKMDLEHCDW